ncbi:SLC13/DASS family transporter [Alteromonas sediminis]|uniref:SLC13/DASS family transporter n=2 Tax=Alteromonas sediminis TaxID=2259342 RepID=A0A3N5Y2K1_9ALTE|nr:SLC13/DASS family transporter [Alteromonas sediminis]
MIKPLWLGIGLFNGLLMALVCTMAGAQPQITSTAAITVVVATLWVSEALPIPVTSIIPFFAFPFSGVLSVQEASSALGSHVILLLMGAFMLSKALEKSNVHERLALNVIHFTGAKNARTLVLSFMFTAAFLSMWISNTATVLMLLPIALAVLTKLNAPALAPMLLLGIAYAGSLGGVGTPVGTPPNIIMISIYEETFGQGINFIQWMKTGVPIVIVAIPIIALWLTRKNFTIAPPSLPKPGNWQSAEIRVLVAFLIVVLSWITRPYWTDALGISGVNDSTVALAGVVLMCLIPDGNKEKPGRLLDWETAQDIPWGMLLLFAGGICLAKAFTASGLSVLLGEQFASLAGLSVILIMLLLCIGVSYLTEITSNTATATLLMPILASAAVAMDIDPLLLMMPAAISASCAFMMPVATAPNAIVYGSGLVPIKVMAREGAILNLIVAFVVSGVVWLTV